MTRLRHPRLTLVLAVLTSTLLVLGILAALANHENAGSGRPGCGGTRVINAADGSVLRCTFDDEFDGTALNTKRWSVVRSAELGFHAGAECYVDDGSHVGVGAGVLTLTVTRLAAPRSCNGRSSNYESGMVSSSGHFSQLYGRFEVRAELPAELGLQPALWMYPQAQTYGRWPNSGEIDIAELFGSDPSQVASHLHFRPLVGTVNGIGQGCPVVDPSGAFHTYGVTWGPREMTFTYDGVTCVSYSTWQPAAPLSPPAPFDHPFYLLLELALGSEANNLPSPTTSLPAHMSVDWVRVWGR